MNGFAESPFLFFMDNVPSIFSIDATKNRRKIVELSDTGCDARIPVAMNLQNPNRYYPSKSFNVKPDENWRWYYERKSGIGSPNDTFRGQGGRDKMDTEELYFIPKEDENIRQHHWQQYSQYRNVDSGIRDFKINSRLSPEQAKMYHRKCDDELYEVQMNVHRDHNAASQNFQDQTNVTRDDYSYHPRKKSKFGAARAQGGYTNYSKIDPRIYDQEVIVERNRTRTSKSAYSDVFEPEEASRNSVKGYWQSWNAPYADHEDPTYETSFKNEKYSRHSSRYTRTANPTNSNDAGRQWEETRGSKIRSRTCSPPDRRKRTRPISKTFYEDTENVENRYTAQDPRESKHASSTVGSACNESLNSPRSTEKLEKFVDRAVDKDSLSDVLTISTSANHLSNATVHESATKEDKTSLKGGFHFWEFIPLDDNSDQKCTKTPEDQKTAFLLQQKIYSGSKSYPQTKRLAEDKDDAVGIKTQRKTQKSAADLDSSQTTSGPSNVKSLDDSSALQRPLSAGGTSRRNPSSDPSQTEQSTKSLVDSSGEKRSSRVTASRIPKSVEVLKRLKDQEQSKEQAKNQSKIESKLAFGWSGKSNQYLKRPNSASKSESNADKKKKVVDNGPQDITGNKKTGMNFVEKTAACLKRKLERKTNEISLTSKQSRILTTEKKIRSEGLVGSKLPIRIGNRFRSKNPVASVVKGNSKPQAAFKEQTTDSGMPEDSRGQQSSVRSRTKPKAKQDVEQSRVDPIAAPMSTMENVHVTIGDKHFGREGQNLSINCTGREESLSKGKLSRNEKPEVNVGKREIDESKTVNLEQDQRKRDFVNRNYEREINNRNNALKEVDTGTSRNNFKEKCFFHLDDENVICNSYCDNKRKNLNSFRSRRPLTIRSRL